tara:strand:+ start:574 stop:798 length:225 start_codon:yes stop_codon:yes gene_type:complete
MAIFKNSNTGQTYLLINLLVINIDNMYINTAKYNTTAFGNHSSYIVYDVFTKKYNEIKNNKIYKKLIKFIFIIQ